MKVSVDEGNEHPRVGLLAKFGVHLLHDRQVVVAGIHEGKGEINARVGYFNVGINLHTEKPAPEQLRAAVEKVTSEKTYRHNIESLSEELENYNSTELCASYINKVLNKQYKTIF